MLSVVSILLASIAAWFRSRLSVQRERIALRHQVAVDKQSVSRPKLQPPGRLRWVWLSRLWPGWHSVVQPETFTRWHRQGFRLFWRWKSRPDRPQIPEPLTSRVASLQKDRYVLPDHLGVVAHPILRGLHHDHALKTRAA